MVEIKKSALEKLKKVAENADGTVQKKTKKTTVQKIATTKVVQQSVVNVQSKKTSMEESKSSGLNKLS